MLSLLFWQADLAGVCLQVSPAMQTVAHAADMTGGQRFAGTHGYNSRSSVPGRKPPQGAALGATGHGGKKPNAVRPPGNNAGKGRQNIGIRPKHHSGRIKIKSGHIRHVMAGKTVTRHSIPTGMVKNNIPKSKHEQYTDVQLYDYHPATGNSLAVEETEISGSKGSTHSPSLTIPIQYEASVVLAVNTDKITLNTVKIQGLQAKRSLSFPHLGMTVTAFEVPAGEDAASAVSRLQKKGADRIMLNQYYRLDAAPKQVNHISDSPDTLANSPLLSLSSGKGIRIGMVDSYVDSSLLPLAKQQIFREAFASGAKEMANDHGTVIAELLVGHRNNTFSGLLPEAMLFAAAAFSETNSDTPRATVLAIIKSLDWLVSRNVQVINLSFSGPDNDMLALAIQKILEKGIPVVAAAGNHGQKGPPAYPGAYNGVIAVTAIDKFLRPYREANQGKYISFAAPGVRVPVPCHDGEVCYKTGTSFAAPYYTALIATHLPQGNETKSIKAILSSLKKDAVDLGAPGRDPVFGWGLVQCDNECLHRKQ
jgi:hypothetical protein